MRAAAIFGLGCSPHHLKLFQDAESPENDWRIGMPSASDQADAILIFGGDGTIHRHLSPLAKLGLPVLIVPSGSGNDFARALGLRSVRDSLTAWRLYCAEKNNVRAIDLGVLTPLEFANVTSAAPQASSPPHDLARESTHAPRYFCSVAGVGLDAEIARRANLLPRWLRGHGGYALAFAPTMFQFAPFSMNILTPTAEPSQAIDWAVKKSQPTLLAAFANTPTYGGGMKIAPHAQMDDGLLDVCVIGSVDPYKLFCMFPTVYFGRHLNIREVDYFTGGHFRIETDHPLDLYADGEYVCRTPVEISVQRSALQVIVPSRTSF
ncbi:MAG: diacylglycerol kinase family protein [Candidatus Sulfotelmatobacter sp.]